MADYVAQETIFNNSTLSVDDKIDALSRLTEAYYGAAASAAFQDKVKTSASGALYGGGTISVEDAYAQVQKEFGKVKPVKVKVKTSAGDKSNDASSSKSGSGKSKSSKSKTKNTKEEIDWLERRLTRMQSIIDLTASKLQNLFSVKKKNSNLDKQISQSTKLLKQYEIAVDRYQKKANSIAKGNGKKQSALPKDVINAVKSGKITTKSYDQLIKKYGQKLADRINKYITYYDKAQEAKKSVQDTKASIRDKKIEKAQNWVDKYDAQAGLAEIRSANAIGYSKQNKYLKEQQKYLEKSYKKQIQIAKLNKDDTEVARLKVELEQKKVELAQQQVDNIKTQYENELSLIQHDQDDIQNQIDLMEAQGRIINAQFYKDLNANNAKQRANLLDELNTLTGQQSKFKKGSSEWYALQDDIQSLENSINEVDVSIVENNKKLIELHDAMIDDIKSNNDRAASEADFLGTLLGSNLIDDKTGNYTQNGLAMMGLYGIQIESSESSSKQYAAEVRRIQALREKNDLGEFQSIEDRDKAYDDYYEKWRESLTDVYNYESKIVDMVTQKYESQLEYLKEIVDAKKNILESEKDLYEYEKNISSQTKNIASLEKQLQALQGDNSESGRLKRQQLQNSLDEAREELQDTEYERYISDQESMLDNLIEEYESRLEELLKDRDTLLKEGLDTINNNAVNIKETIDKYKDAYGYDYSADFAKVISNFTTGFSNVVTSVGQGASLLDRTFDNLANEIINLYNTGNYGNGNDNGGDGDGNDYNPGDTIDFSGGGAAGENYAARQDASLVNTPASSGVFTNAAEEKAYAEQAKKVAQSKVTQVRSYIGANVSKAKKKRSEYSDVNKVIYDQNSGKVLGDSELRHLATILGVTYNNASSSGNLAKALREIGYPGFSTGGIIRSSRLPNSGDNALIRVNPDETILTKKFTDMLPGAVDIMSNLNDSLRLPYMGNTTKDMSNTIGDVHFDIELPNVTDVRSFGDALKNDVNTQRIFTVAIKDLLTNGKITNNIRRF